MNDPLSVKSKRIIEERCTRFEDDWQNNGSSEIENYLADSGDVEQANLLIELVRLDVYYRQRNGERTLLSDYENRFPASSGLLRLAFGEADVLTGETSTTSRQKTVKIPALSKGQNVGRYRVKEILKSGAFGTVYKAYDNQLARYVCVKTPKKDEGIEQDAINGFLAEAQVLAGLKQRVFVEVYDVGCFEKNSPFLVMQYIEAGSLKDLVEEGGWPLDKSVKFIADVADGLELAHKKSLVHRDLKPANILIDENDQPKIADFGLAIYEHDRWNRLGEIAGTPSYMAPEQVGGKINLVDRRTDVWALGVTLYELATGKLPFEGGAAEEVKNNILNKAPTLPSKINSEISTELDAILIKALSKARHERFDSASDFAQKLRELLDKRDAAPAVTVSSLLRPSQASFSVALGIVALLVALIALTENSFNTNYNSKLKSREFVTQLFDAEIANVATVIEENLPLTTDTVELLSHELEHETKPWRKRRACLALAQSDSSHIPYLYDSLFDEIAPVEFTYISGVLNQIDDSFAERLQHETAVLCSAYSRPAAISDDIIELFKNSSGFIEPNFAFGQTIPIEQFVVTNAELADADYQIEQARPFQWDGHLFVAAIWIRGASEPGGANSQLRLGLTESGIASEHAKLESDGYCATNVASYRNEKGPIVFCGIWKKQEPSACVGIYCNRKQLQTLQDSDASIRTKTRFDYETKNGIHETCGVWVTIDTSQKSAPEMGNHFELTPSYFDKFPHYQSDVSVRATQTKMHFEKCWKQRNHLISNLLGTKNEDSSTLLMNAKCLYYQRDFDGSIDLLTKSIEMSPKHFSPYIYRALANAWQGNTELAKSDLKQYNDCVLRSRFPQFLRGAVNMWLDASIDFYLGNDQAAIDVIEANLVKHRYHSEYCVYGASAYAAGAEYAIENGDATAAEERKSLAIELLGKAIENGLTNVDRLKRVPELRGLFGDPRFDQLINGRRSIAVYGGDWTSNTLEQSTTSCGLRPDLHLAHARMLAAQGFKPSAVSVAQIGNSQTLLTASTWHRTSNEGISRAVKSMIALLKVEQTRDEFWQLFEKRDARIERCFNNLTLAHSIPPESFFNSYMVQSDTDVRRVLLRLIGSCRLESVRPGFRKLLESELSKASHDPDPGIQSISEWLCRKMGKSLSYDSISLASDNDRNWFFNSQGQKLIAFPESQKFWAPLNAKQSLLKYRRTVPLSLEYSVAIGAREVTTGQFRRYQDGFDSGAATSDSATNISFFEAAQYCNWLSRQEGFQEFYRFDESGPQPNVSFLPPKKQYGYRLLTAWEWDLVQTDRLLWGTDNSTPEHNQLAKLPSRIGIYASAGGVHEWTTNSFRRIGFSATRSKAFELSVPISDSTFVVLRGGLPPVLDDNSPRVKANSQESSRDIGFRICRTLMPLDSAE